MAKPKKTVKGDYKEYQTPGQVEGDGSTIRMTDGAVFKRVVLPSVHRKSLPALDPAIDVDELFGDGVNDGQVID